MRKDPRSRRRFAVLWFVGVVLVLGLLPAVARAEWLQTGASIADRSGTGYVGLLNVDVKNTALNDSTAVTEVWLSDDGEQWSVAPFTGEPQPWVLAGESGAKTVFVRFAGADGSLSPVVSTGIRVDTEPPRTQALLHVVGSSGARTRFAYRVTDSGSPTVTAQLVVRSRGEVVRVVPLGKVSCGRHVATVALRLPRGRYTWNVRAVDLAQWTQTRATAKALVMK